MIARTAAGAVLIVAVLGLSACTSSTAGGGQAETQTSSTATSPVASSPQSSTQPAPTTSVATTPVASTPAQAKALVASVEHVDANTFQTGSYSPNVPASHMENVIQFTTPSGNIRCTMTLPDSLWCEIVKFDFTAPTRPADCHLNWTSMIQLDTAGATMGACVGGPEVTYLSRVLPYGRAIQALGVGCYSSSAALTCVDMNSGHGFSLNKTAFTHF